MHKKISVIAIFVFAASILAACGETIPTAAVPVDSTHHDVVLDTCPPFDSVNIVGDFDVTIQQTPDKYQLKVISYHTKMTKYPRRSTHWVQNRTLYVRVDPKNPGSRGDKVRLIIDAPKLKDVHLNGTPNGKISYVTGPEFSLNIENSGLILIAGNTRRFNATVSEHSKLNARCMRAYTLFVNTVDNAQAEVTNSNGLSAIAANASNVYYYQDPAMVAEHLKISGSVIRMHGLTRTGEPQDVFGPQIECPAKDGKAVHGYG